MRQPLLCDLVMEFPAKVAFEGETRIALGHFTPPNRFWRAISEHKFNSHTKRLHQSQKILFWF